MPSKDIQKKEYTDRKSTENIKDSLYYLGR